MAPRAIQEAIKLYINRIKKEVNISEAYLVGSYARNTAMADVSDVDLLILSDDFANYDVDERSRILYRASVAFPYDLHVFGVTTNEMNSASPLTTLGQIKNSPKIPVSV